MHTRMRHVQLITQIDAYCSPCGLGKNCSSLDGEDCIILVYMCQVNKILNVK